MWNGKPLSILLENIIWKATNATSMHSCVELTKPNWINKVNLCVVGADADGTKLFVLSPGPEFELNYAGWDFI